MTYIFFLNWSLSHFRSGLTDTSKTLWNLVENVTGHNIICTIDAGADLAEETDSSLRRTWKQHRTQIFQMATGQMAANISIFSDQNFFIRRKPFAVIMNWCESLSIRIQDKDTILEWISCHQVTKKTGHFPCLILGNEMDFFIHSVHLTLILSCTTSLSLKQRGIEVMDGPLSG